MRRKIAEQNIAAKNHPKIKEFAELALEKKFGELTMDDIQSRAFQLFWKSFVISEYDDEAKDFKFRLWGVNLVNGYGEDFTGKYFKDCDFGEFEEEIRSLNKLVIDELRAPRFNSQVHNLRAM